MREELDTVIKSNSTITFILTGTANMKFNVTIKEVFNTTYEVEADNEEQAKELASLEGEEIGSVYHEELEGAPITVKIA